MNKNRVIILKVFLLIAIIVCSIPLAFAKLSLPAIFCNDMILQRQQPILIWGKTDANQHVTISFNHKVYTCVSDANGLWRGTLSSMQAGGPYQMIISNNYTNEKVTIDNILIGEVWICAGQSNMNFMLASDRDAKTELKENNFNIREFRCALPSGSMNPENSENSKWVSAIGESAKKQFSAVAYYFAKNLQLRLKVPVGIIVMSCGATRAETWTDPQILQTYPALQAFRNYWSSNINNKKESLNNIPGKFYKDVVLPIAPFAAKGLIWYQGESNTLPDNSGRSITERANEYKSLLKGLIQSYRIAWLNRNLPVYVIQLPNFIFPSGDIQWAKIRQAQLDVVDKTPHTGLIVTIDVGDSTNIHPNNKSPLGVRLANLALTNEYGIRFLYPVSSPVIKQFKIEGNKVILSFTDMGKASMFEKNLKGFEIADVVHPEKFIKASAVLINNQVIVTAPEVKVPVIVRYAWADNPSVSLFNSEGLPASPFTVNLIK